MAVKLVTGANFKNLSQKEMGELLAKLVNGFAKLDNYDLLNSNHNATTLTMIFEGQRKFDLLQEKFDSAAIENNLLKSTVAGHERLLELLPGDCNDGQLLSPPTMKPTMESTIIKDIVSSVPTAFPTMIYDLPSTDNGQSTLSVSNAAEEDAGMLVIPLGTLCGLIFLSVLDAVIY